MNVHEMDQVFAAFIDMSRMMFKYYRELVDSGFTDKQAMELVKDFQREQLSK